MMFVIVLHFLVIKEFQMLRQIFLTALLTGVLAGFILTSLQSVKIIPLILAAEQYEDEELIIYPSSKGIEHKKISQENQANISNTHQYTRN